MAINWKLRETVFRLLAAVYAELGEEVFKGRYASIAQCFGPDATYDAIKSFFNKEVSRASEQLLAKHRARPRSSQAPLQRRDPTRSRPPLLYFDDEDISILTQREAEAHFSHSLRAPAKRPRVVAASPAPSAIQDVPLPAMSTARELTDSQISGKRRELEGFHLDSASAPLSASPSSHPRPSSYVTADGQIESPASGLERTGKKRAYSTFSELADMQLPHLPVPGEADTSKPGSFGYITKQGQYRCALCLSQLPSQQDLDRHELLSKEHQRKLQNPITVAKGREKLLKVTSIPNIGPHISTPAPAPARQQTMNGVDREKRTSANSETPRREIHGDTDKPAGPSNLGNRPRDGDTPFDTIEVLSQAAHPAESLEQRQAITGTSMSPAERPSHRVDKGKGRAPSPLSLSPTPVTDQVPCPDPSLFSEAEIPGLVHTRPTTARTEIGSITPAHSNGGPSRALRDGSAPVFSQTEIADIMRSTELVMQLMGCVQKEAVAAANAKVGSGSDASSSIGRPGREAAQRNPQEGRVKGGRAKDTGEEVFFIILD
ncbi:hypothetical protein A1O1_02091 [Capronia coronata CBS 617.96]|uniref:DUF7066 domain-containing protein n=1 Tax=Capronia coronata CBS 617.96 TaxID=1182541 RepID=W9ZGR0_9EURO|nr:uncharacterized protein A1O1_02091 [Capronia coronata CBS 617.96]EXJ93699.1 hypothetical protein A1O1_02091 [Capronia coronata CBS 617.96]